MFQNRPALAKADEAGWNSALKWRGDSIFEEDAEQPLVTNSFFETDIREVLRDISAQTKVKIVPDETVQGAISIELKEVSLEEALRMVLSVGNYTFRKMPEGYYLVGLCTPNSPSFNRLSLTEYFRPNHLKAKELQSLVPEFYRQYIQINEAVNSITIAASPEIIKRIKEDLIKFDQPLRQVMIEALVIEISEDGKKYLGVNWGPMLEGGFSIYPPSTFAYARSAEGKGNWALSGTLSSDLFSRINTLISDGKAKIRANPRIATLEGKEAAISVAREEYYLINVGASQTAYYSLQSINTGVILKIIPYIDKDRQITVSIAPEVSEVVGQGATDLPVINKRTAATTLRVDNGQTIAIGGLIQEESSETINRVPILGAIPGVKHLFTNKQVVVENKEVVIFITPRLIDEDNLVADNADMHMSSRFYNPGEDKVNKLDQQLINKDKKIVFDIEDPVQRYYSQVVEIIDTYKCYSNSLKSSNSGEKKEVTLRFTIFSNGSVGKVEVLVSSGDPLLDSSAVKLVENLSLLPSFPEEINQRSIAFVVPIRYEF